MAKKAQTKKMARRELGLIRYLRETRAELRKVTWPTRQEARSLTTIVIGVTVAFAVFLGGLDRIFSLLFQLIFT